MNREKNDFYKIKDVAEILHVSKQTIAVLIKSGKLKTLKVGSRARRISSAELEKFISENS